MQSNKLHIGFITYELPPDIAQGGIGTYTLQASRMMKSRGHEVEIFSGTYTNPRTETYMDILVHRIKCSDVHTFRENVVTKFKEVHSLHKFDVVESPEINGNAHCIISMFPNLPHVVKLHTPSVLIVRILNTYQPIKIKLKYVIGAFVRGKIDMGYWSKHDKNQYKDVDYLVASKASIITSPSMAMKLWAQKFWRIPENKIKIVPNPYIPDSSLLKIAIERKTNYITFLGRLNVLKGLINLSKAILIVQRKCPEIQFRIIGKDGPSHIRGLSMRNYLDKKLNKFPARIEFIDGIELSELPGYLSKTDILVVPSLWENFPTVCLEGMAAGCGIIAGNVGGTNELLNNNECGITVNPHKYKAIARAIISLIKNDELRFKKANAARSRLLTVYNNENIGRMMEKVYQGVICEVK